MDEPAPPTAAFALRAPVRPDELPALHARFGELLARSAAPVVVCDVAQAAADALTVAALARMQLMARRSGRALELRGASPELLGLIAFMGLCDALPCARGVRSSRGRERG